MVQKYITKTRSLVAPLYDHVPRFRYSLGLGLDLCLSLASTFPLVLPPLNHHDRQVPDVDMLLTPEVDHADALDADDALLER